MARVGAARMSNLAARWTREYGRRYDVPAVSVSESVESMSTSPASKKSSSLYSFGGVGSSRMGVSGALDPSSLDDWAECWADIEADEGGFRLDPKPPVAAADSLRSDGSDEPSFQTIDTQGLQG